MARDNWTWDQLTIALNLYWRIPYNKISGSSNLLIADTASLIGRTPAALAYKLMNFTSLDEEKLKIGNRGKSASSSIDKEVWSEYFGEWERLAYDATKILSTIQKTTLERIVGVEDEVELTAGKEREGIVKIRINQNDFRQRVLASYNGRCCITGLSVPSLLVASHIIPWSQNSEERLNPRNGLCLNSLHDRAFDRGLISISTDYKVILSESILQRKNDTYIQKYFVSHENQLINLPDRFLPSKDFLIFHQRNIFNK